MPRTKHNKICIDCGKKISYLSVRCKSCANKFRAGTYNKKSYSGNESPNWKGGVSTRYYKKLQKEHMQELCYFCNSNYGLSVHHIDGNRNNNELKNLKVVCRSCHKKIHDLIKAYGKQD